MSGSKIRQERKGKYFTLHHSVPIIACRKLRASSPEKMPVVSHPWSTHRDLSKALFSLPQPQKTRKKINFLTEIRRSIKPQIHFISRKFTEPAAVFNLFIFFLITWMNHCSSSMTWTSYGKSSETLWGHRASGIAHCYCSYMLKLVPAEGKTTNYKLRMCWIVSASPASCKTLFEHVIST